jgi:hypothetical protein
VAVALAGILALSDSVGAPFRLALTSAGFAAAHLLSPVGLDALVGSLPGWFWVAGLVALGGVAVLAAAGWPMLAGRPELLFLVLFLAAALVPVSSMTEGTRYLYLASMPAALLAGLKSLRPDLQVQGIGGPLMQAEGLHSLFAMDELSVMGLAEVLPKYAHLKRRIREAAADVLAAAPDALITIDSPDFVLRVARIVRAARPDLRTIHYVAPSVWAWRPGRAAKMAHVIDHVLALLPFEPPYMTAAGMTCDFVGHPVVSEPLATPAEVAAFQGDGPLILTLPGSRRGEVTRLAPIFGQTLARVHRSHPDARVVLPTLASIEPLIRSLTADWPIAPQIITDPGLKRGAFAAAEPLTAQRWRTPLISSFENYEHTGFIVRPRYVMLYVVYVIRS